MSELQQRIEGRQFGEEMIQEAIQEQDKAWIEGFSRALEQFCKQDERALEGMSEERAKQFERQRINFGQYAGTTMKEVPIDYLAWLVDSNLELANYLKSKRGKKRLESDDEVRLA